MANALAAQAAHQGFANDVLRFLHERGSKIDLLIIQKFSQADAFLMNDEFEPDANGHMYPNYVYMKCASHNRLGSPSVVAVPVR